MRDFLKKIRSQGIEHLIFISATIMSAGIHFVYSIYVKAFVDPLEYGMYSTCLLLQTYMAYLQLGALNAFNRDYPQLVGAGKKEEANKYRNTVFSFLISIYLISVILVTIGVMILSKSKSLDSRFTIGFILTAVITFVTIIENFGNYRCRIDKGFKYSSIVTLLELLSIPIGLVLVPRIGYYAIYITSILAMVIGIICYYKPSFKDFHFGLDRTILKMVLISGLPLLVNGLIWTVINSIDKFVILGYIDTEALGIYGIAQNAFSYMVLIPSAMSQLFYVRMGKEYGESGKVSVLTDMSMKFSTILAALTSFIALVAYYFLPIMVDVFMPKYSSGVPAAQILIVGLSVYAATLVSGNILTILRQNVMLLKNSIYMCIFNVVCSVGYMYIIGRRIEGVALGTATSYVFCTLIIIYQVYKSSGCSIIKQIRASVLPVVISLLPGILLYSLIENRIIGCVISVFIVFIFYWIFYRKQIQKIVGGK